MAISMYLTFSRPRDIIKILKYCSEEVSSQRLTLTDVQRAEERYSDWFYREFRDEVQSFMPCWKGALNCISEIARGKEKVAILIERLKGNNEVSNGAPIMEKNLWTLLKSYLITVL